MFDLFDDTPAPDVAWHPSWLTPSAAAEALARIVAEADWRQERIRTPGGWVDQPRLTAWQGDEGAVYIYSGIRNIPQPWTRQVAELRDAISALCGVRFNSVLLNRYRMGTDSMGWHADHEPELGPEPVIASLSLGATRRFDLRHNATGVVRSFQLTSGSLLVMQGKTQAQWRHRVPKEPAVTGERVNLTFRVVTPALRT
ncbi:alpha-ketoglutarate-dependent dioxygenase AlkB family protein [Paraburkholderia acidiphila]|uniref:Alpha-ketoglutarate-dependent dioxygenase AlkB n=1 Tax=Paraburkholderia acidiphila TaxID=2571747 RepID=A0A7Z2G809_9BURK|nr:alpha-ketoglutarate-dependent dioxygenase AlkB [Paraburkholderia acidiphila]QGZ56479.1 alpha-ketoglutarate-dependent dioxygenase AlkB [Paraburkholderia acidiphila]